MTEPLEKTSEQLHREWLDHPHFRYRGCAPDVDDPMRMAGNPALHVGAHHGPDAWVPEGQKERRAREDAAIEVCLNCPVMVQCDAYASSVVWVNGMPKVAEPDGVWGGRRSLERHKALIESRPETVAAPDHALRTPQKRAVLRALAVCWDPFEVAEAAGLDVRTANWQRSIIVTKLGLAKDASRMRVLAVARERGLLDGVDLVVDDGTVPAVPPPTRVTAVDTVETVVEPVGSAPEVAVWPHRRPRRSSRVRVIPGQLAIFDETPTPAPNRAPATVKSLFPSHSQLGAAA
ncbi:WhiB family transcriptional regulator [Streptomyces griseosporeus]|uniref:WhiB family transcriptional regulator n=1 Tax=Streptomyces griseosporeus TaxID=1910 RepID=UPI00370049B1